MWFPFIHEYELQKRIYFKYIVIHTATTSVHSAWRGYNDTEHRIFPIKTNSSNVMHEFYPDPLLNNTLSCWSPQLQYFRWDKGTCDCFYYSHCSLAPRGRHPERWSFKDRFQWLDYILENDLKVWAVTVWGVFGLLTGTQHERPVLVGGEAQRRDARSFRPVSSVTERLRERRRCEDTCCEIIFSSHKLFICYTGCQTGVWYLKVSLVYFLINLFDYSEVILHPQAHKRKCIIWTGLNCIKTDLMYWISIFFFLTYVSVCVLALVLEQFRQFENITQTMVLITPYLTL